MNQSLEKWKERLIDLSKRNRLLNFKESKASAVEIFNPDIERLYAYISTGRAYEVFDFDMFCTKKRERFVEGEEALTFDALIGLAKANINLSKFLVANRNVTTAKALKELSGKAKSSIAEQGINILHMAFGFMSWKESEASEEIFWAPLVLIPVKIEGRGGIDPFKIALYEEEVLINPTLKYKLKTAFNITLPEITDDMSITRYLEIVASLVLPFGWTVANCAYISTFSFTKLNMYLDIKDNETLVLANPSIQKLIGDTSAVTASTPSPGIEQNPMLHNVVNADSSQNEAIIIAEQGNSLVLQGPPGTGKSQTITNLIANYLANGKKVLFVSEKLAALNVVFNNLKKAGLEDYCLELHSHKSDKKTVIAELNRVLMLSALSISQTKYDSENEQYERSVSHLNAYADIIQRKVAGIGRSPYEIYCQLSHLSNIDDIEYPLAPIAEKDDAYFAQATDYINKFIQFVPFVGEDFRTHCWFGLMEKTLGYDEKISLKNQLVDVAGNFEVILDNYHQINAKGIFDAASTQQIIDVSGFIRFIFGCPEFNLNGITLEKADALLKQLNDLARLSKTNLALKTALAKLLLESGLSLDAAGLLERFKTDYLRPGRIFQKSYRADSRLIREQTRKRLSYAKKVAMLELLTKYQKLSKAIAEISVGIMSVVPSLVHGPETDWAYLIDQLEKVHAFIQRGVNVSGFAPEAIPENKERYLGLVTMIDNAYKASEADAEQLQAWFDPKAFSLLGFPVEQVIGKLNSCYAQFDNLTRYMQFNEVLSVFKKLGIYDLICKLIDRQIPKNQYISIFEKTYYAQWISFIFQTNSLLGQFNRLTQDNYVAWFVEKDKLQMTLARAFVNAKLSSLRPNSDLVTSNSMAGMLKREAQKKRKLMPVRMAFQQMGSLILNLKPCFLMSPLSVSTYIDPNAMTFDVVIFDEASQIFPEDAVGSIYRAKQVIVVGDSKQMPPSNFFIATSEDEEINEDATEEEIKNDATSFESILKLSEAVFPHRGLHWHYRSRTEDLITFSNTHFYNGELVTFPSNIKKSEGFGVDYIYCPNGVFDRRTHTNLEEAKMVAQLVFDNFVKYPNRSVGVVAFSLAQQKLIEDIVNQMREGNPDKESFFSEAILEPFFIKNLETVQGDERDTIIFSIAYGYDSDKRFLHNFGPLNRDGGERRLNVAITRAKYNVKVVASIHGTDIDLDRTKSVGAALLKSYLDYAEQKQRPIVKKDGTGESVQSYAISDEIAQFLKDNGYDTDIGIGDSGDKIDVAVKSDDKSHYVMCIETDDEDYFKYKNISDRDRLRKEILERMGWKYYRIWSTEWIKNPASEKRQLLETLAELKNDTLVPINMAPSVSETAVPATVTHPVDSFVEIQTGFSFEKYKNATKYDLPFGMSHAAIGIGEHTLISQAIARIIQIEGPIKLSYLSYRVIYLLNFPKSHKSKLEIESIAKQLRDFNVVKNQETFYWQKREPLYPLRIPNDDPEVRVRQLYEIPTEELADALYKLVKANVSIDKEELFRSINTTARGLNYSAALGEESLSSLSAAVRYLTSLGLVKTERGKLLLVK